MSVRVESIKIEVGAHYLLIIQGPDEMIERLMRHNIHEAAKQGMEQWLESDDPFFIIALSNEFQVRLEKVEK